MITCSSCGKANQPTRKFCIRCGASLLAKIQAPVPKAPAPAVETRIAASEAPAKKPAATRESAPSEKPSVTSGDKWVRPSEVSRDRLRTAERHTEKTELEKAREAFAVADGVDPEQRMLRASELRELMASPPPAPAPRAAPEPRAAAPSEPPRAASLPRATRPVEPAPAAPVPRTEARMQPVNSVEPSMPPVPRPSSGTPPEEPQMSRWTEQPSDEALPSAAREPPLAAKPSMPPVAQAPPTRMVPPAVRTSPSVAPRPPVLSPSQYPDDSRIREIESDISHFSKQCRDLETELERTRSRLDEEVERYGAVAESKRIRAETLEEDTRRAKSEWSDADKEYRRVKSRRDKEVSDAQKRIDDQAKRIKNAEMAREKRIRELEKEKQA